MERSRKDAQLAVANGMSDEKAKELFSNLISDRVAKHVLRIPTRTPLTIAEVLGKKR
jgi:hypothetical protein